MIRTLLGLGALSSLLLMGCDSGGGARKSTYQVTGTVTLNNSPVSGATVTFSPVADDGRNAMGLTDDDGVYTLTTYDSGDGAIPGEYKVMVSKQAPRPAGGDEPEHDPSGTGTGAPASHAGGGRGGGGGGGSTSLLPEEYASASTTPLQETVGEEENVIDIEL